MLLSPVWLIAFGLPDWRLCLLLMLPMLADGFAQRLTPYQSGNLRRLVTGMLFGGLDGVCGAAGVPDWTAFKEVRKQSRRLQKGDAWTVLQLNIEIAVDHERGIFGLTPG